MCNRRSYRVSEEAPPNQKRDRRLPWPGVRKGVDERLSVVRGHFARRGGSFVFRLMEVAQC